MQENEQLAKLLNRSSDAIAGRNGTVQAVSGTAIGEVLGISRMGAQKRIRSLVENGLPLSAVPGKGYTLETGVSLLSAESIGAYLDPELCESIEVLQSVGSSNSHLLSQDILNSRAKICVAEAQNSGRGRRGNDWQSAPYRNVMLSISWGFDHWPETITGLGLAVALVITETVNARYDLDVKIKWPNDLIVGGDKLAGILIDVAGESSGACNVVVGLGLNVHQPDWSPAESAYRWIDLQSLTSGIDRNELIGSITKNLTEMLAEFACDGFEPMVERWNDLSSYRTEKVRVGTAERYVEGFMDGVDNVGALLIRGVDGQPYRFADSNVSVRLISNAEINA